MCRSVWYRQVTLSSLSRPPRPIRAGGSSTTCFSLELRLLIRRLGLQKEYHISQLHAIPEVDDQARTAVTS